MQNKPSTDWELELQLLQPSAFLLKSHIEEGSRYMVSEVGDITSLIQQWRTGNRDAADKLIERVYPELKKIACAYVHDERLDHTLAPTALVNELYLKFIRSSPAAVENRTHFFALAAQSLRHILVDYARIHNAKKRHGNAVQITLGAANIHSEPQAEDVLSIDEALNRLQELDSRLAQIVELRFFGGLNEQEVAQTIGVSKNTVQRDWRAARAWLMSRLATAKTPGTRSS